MRYTLLKGMSNIARLHFGAQGSEGNSSMASALRLFFAFSVALLLAACGAVIPSEGPSAGSIVKDASAKSETADEYLIIPVSAQTIATQLRFEERGLRATFGSKARRIYTNRIGVGDILQINIWEAAEGGLFSTADSKGTQLPPIKVNERGYISIPFVGIIKAAGLTPLQLQKRIEKALSGKAISPQVLVNIARNRSNTVVVNGDVRKPGKYEISLKGDRVLDMIAAAGGAAGPARETMLTLIRGRKRAVQNLKKVISDPSENIYVQPGDQIYLSHNPQTYTALGAVTKTGEYAFDKDRVNLMEAVARAGGLLDNRASPRGVFLFRYERNRVLRAMGYSGDQLNPSGATPVVYLIDFSNPRAFFLAQGFLMRDNDVVYVANSMSTDLMKFLELLNATTSAVRGTVATARQF